MQELEVERAFLERWKNRLAVETGVLEGLYSIDAGVTETLVERGFDAALIPHDSTDQDPTVVVNLLWDQRSAVDLAGVGHLGRRRCPRRLRTAPSKQARLQLLPA